ncbi:MAG TPA: tRNA (adenosine(37)-N6)-threonylcarbamoyltransferase complex transferase subunit TsaD [Candidatus Saccharimonadales bacterium]|nr:tRNA (adenosine(37)-N6)-threonylcarbamoyltransferase complex transferase subunit TsaD [Candidatus Saccharimonadales bacterium]
MMLILGIESSCDETAAAVVRDGQELLSNVVNSQIDIHAAYGGVIPEIAARSHIEVIMPVIEQALLHARVTWDDIDAIAVTHAPGLIGSLLIGSLAARTIALIKQKPLYGIHHVESHTYANFLTSGIKLSIPYPESQPQFPLLSLTVSGGHSQLVLFEDHGKYRLLGQTRDDAVGEAFDKVAKIIGLPYPGGPSIAKAAETGNTNKYDLPKARMENPYDFSFSGLKTAVLRAVQRECGVDHTFPSFKLSERLSQVQQSDFAASFQRVAVETLVDKTVKAYKEFQPKSVVIAGGVAANQELRRQLKDRLPTVIAYAPMELCTDNGAMVATLGYYQAKLRSPDNPLTLSVVPSLSMTKTSWQ